MKPTRPQKTRGYKNLRLCLFTFQLMFLQLLSSLFRVFFTKCCILFRCQLGRCYKLETRALESNPIFTPHSLEFEIFSFYIQTLVHHCGTRGYHLTIEIGMTQTRFPSLALVQHHNNDGSCWLSNTGWMKNTQALLQGPLCRNARNI